MQFVHNIYERKIGKGKIDEDMWGEYVRIYRDAVSKGYGMSQNTSFDRSSRMADQIEHNIEVFSAFKTHNQQELMAQKMLKDGKRVGFDEFKAAVEPIARHHNGAWLQTEYATASLRAAQAADWQEFEQNADIFPNLKWMPTTSARPDEAVHGTYSGLTGPQVILPIHDPFWDNHRPGDRWNCKCGLEPTDEPSLHQTNKQAAARAEQGKPTGQRGLQANPGKKGEVFDTKHPYFPKNCKQCPFFSVSTGVKNASTTPHCQDCNKPPKAEKKTKEVCKPELKIKLRESEEIIREIEKSKDVQPPEPKQYTREEKGIFKSRHHGANEIDENLNIARELRRHIKKDIYLLPNLNCSSNSQRKTRRRLFGWLLEKHVKRRKNPDFFIGGETYDGKVIFDPSRDLEKIKNKIQDFIGQGVRQGDNVIIAVPDFLLKENIDDAVKGWFSVNRKSRAKVLILHKHELYAYCI